ncbi:3-hydroxyacyl-CoA dehydrogenase family protein [Cupriavidus basilensis]
MMTEMMLMLEEGATPEQIDKVMVGFGYPMGPFAVNDHFRSRRELRRTQAPRGGEPGVSQAARPGPGWWKWAARVRRPAPAGTPTEMAIARRIRTTW